MLPECLDAPLFIKDGQKTPVDLAETSFFYNEHGRPAYVRNLPPGLKPLDPAGTDPKLAIGREYVVSGEISKQTSDYGMTTQLGFIAEEVVYEPMWATRDVAAAFGITLVEKGQAVKLSSPVQVLSKVDYTYGVFAGHWSPYQKTGNRLLSVVCTDLEHHNFPHVFASTDPHYFPLVISVGRYWPKLGKIRLADLWVPQGSALYIPPKPLIVEQACVDLHTNRNSAHACWGSLEHDKVETQTLLQVEGGYFYWFWNALSTIHTNLTSNQPHTHLPPKG